MTESIREAAERALREEQERTRAARLAELEAAEFERRAAELQEAERAAELAGPPALAAELGERRRVLEEQAEKDMDRLVRTLRALLVVDGEHTSLLSAIGDLPAGILPLQQQLPEWTSVRLGPLAPGSNYDGYGGASLAERDQLTPTAE
jgi:predicted deacylase